MSYLVSSFIAQVPNLQGVHDPYGSYHLNEIGARLYGRCAATHLQLVFDNP
ncbi:hypothetical protein D3C77_84110 [compost metagenome]